MTLSHFDLMYVKSEVFPEPPGL